MNFSEGSYQRLSALTLYIITLHIINLYYILALKNWQARGVQAAHNAVSYANMERTNM